MVPIEYLNECLSADPDAGLLIWKNRPRHHFCGDGSHLGWNSQWPGRVAGRINQTGYRFVTLAYQGKSRKLLAHRVLWALHYGAWPTMQIDHINHVRHDNRIANLRDVDGFTNRCNRTKHSDNPIGVRKQRNRFSAYITRNKRQVHLGMFDSATDAHLAYLSAALAA